MISPKRGSIVASLDTENNITGYSFFLEDIENEYLNSAKESLKTHMKFKYMWQLFSEIAFDKQHQSILDKVNVGLEHARRPFQFLWSAYLSPGRNWMD